MTDHYHKNKPTLLRSIVFIFLFFFAFSGFSAIPPGYYNGASGLNGASLKTALYNIIKNHTALSYDALWNAFETTDDKANGKVWDMYSDIPGGTPPYEYTFGSDQCGTYSGEGDCYNREHSFPRSWFGGEVAPMNSDLFHIVPTDGYVNGQRGDYPYGKVGTASWTSQNGCKVGNCVTSGYTGTVFEPLDEYKGDFARNYFYMATRYENLIASWENKSATGNVVLNGTSYPAYESWYVALLLQWHAQDPVSQKELDRNDAVYLSQNNRNPFIDHPEYASAIWAPAALPTVTTTAATSVTMTTATLNGTVNPNGLSASCYFEWGTTTSYGNTTTVQPAGSGTSPVSMNAAITGLSAGTTYHYRLVATGTGGTSNGNDLTFTTTAPTLQVSPSSINVPATAGSADFTVTSNTSWTAVSNQSWCTVPASGSGNSTLTATYTANPGTSARTASITVTVAGLTPIVVSVVQPAPDPSAFQLSIRNVVQTSPSDFEFDLILRDWDPSQPFELATFQCGITLNPGIYNGGTLSSAIVAGTSELPPAMQPTSTTFTQSTNTIKLAGKVPPGPGNGAIISTGEAGTRLIRLKISNTVSFTSSTWANLHFNGSVTTGYATRVAQYINGINTQLTVTPDVNAVVIDPGPILNGPPALAVTPANQSVTGTPGSVSYQIDCNASWTATSDQAWCTVTPASGYGNTSLTATYTENNAAARTANITVTVAGLSPAVVTLSQAAAPLITVNLKAILEGLYDGAGGMNAASDESGPYWGAGIADKITVELHDASNYSTVHHTAENVSLTTAGIAAFTVPGNLNGNYFLTLHHRNTLTTVTAAPVSFAVNPVNYDFSDDDLKAFGTNMIEVDGGVFAFYGGDVNQDGYVDSGDLSEVDNDSSSFATGYLASDVTGDGFTDSGDMSIIDNNNALFVTAVTP